MRFALRLGALVTLAAATSRAGAQRIDLGATELVDLTHPFNAQTLYWPTSPSTFRLERLAFGRTERGYFYAAYSLCTPEHGGTHLDAPIHFAEGKRTSDQIPLAQLVVPVVVIDVAAAARANRDYRLTPDDVRNFERRNGPITPRSAVLVRTGWSRFWPNRRAYFGDDKAGDASNLHFPGFGEEAARLLVAERRVALLGIDSPSIDHGPSTDFVVHQVVSGADVPALENLTNLDRLPATGAVLVALPMKIEGGSGGPARVIAFVPRRSTR